MAIEYNKLKDSDTVFVLNTNNNNNNNNINNKSNKNNIKNSLVPLFNVDYQKNGLIKKIFSFDNNNSLLQPVELAYDEEHRLKSLLLPGNQESFPTHLYSYHYQANTKNLKSVEMNGHTLVQYDYDNDLQVRRK